VWAENQAGQHTFENLEKVVKKLESLDKTGASKDQIERALKRLGEEAAGR
jgi:hypothetical protein